MKKDKIKLISRRDFLKLAGLTTAGAAAGHFLFSDLVAVPGQLLDRMARKTGKETWVNTVCGQCSGGCGLRVRLIDGIPVYIKGNPHYPVNRGGVCPMAHTSLEVLFNPDRVKNPLIRVGSKDQNRFNDMDWNQALTALHERFKALIAKGAGHKIAMINGDRSPLMRELSKYWMKAVGSPNYFEDETLMENSMGVLLSQGINEIPAYDLERSKYILNFGCNFLEEGTSPVYYQRVFGRLRSVTKEAKTTLIHIDSRMNLTGASSHRWIPIQPGTYGALALGIAHVLIADQLYDKDYIEKNTFGFEPFRDKNGHEHVGFKSYVRKNYYPEKVSEITGIPTETIIKLAEEFGTHGFALAIGGDASKYASNGSVTQWGIYCLNALKGNIQKEGGVFFTSIAPGFSFPAINRDAAAGKVGEDIAARPPFGDVSVHNFAEAVLSGKPGLIDTLLIVDANPVFHSRDKNKMIQALKKIENVVVMGTFLDETAEHADLFLPDHSFLEKTDVSGPIPGMMFSHVGLVQPVIEPLFNTKQCGDVLVELGKTLKGRGLFPWKNYAEIVNKRFEVLYESGEGTIIAETVDSEWDRYLNQRGWKSQQYESFQAFLKLVRENGGWWDQSVHIRPVRDIFHTPTEKFEFFSSILQQHLEGKPAAAGKGLDAAKGDERLMPHYDESGVPGAAGEFPLILTVSQLLTNRDGKGASQPSMMEMVGIQVGRHWKSWIEINPETATMYGIKDRRLAWVESVKDRVKAEARFFPGILPGVVHIHLGLGHTSYGRFGTGIGINAVDLIENKFDSLSSIPVLNGTRVRVKPVI
ncbi:MAG: molybdopterin-dependent oxidoreductase [Candidatus Aminicenantes bacterium]|nr:molybdopterin-dependent oxidoreductase [Candidatus Aminicenantes bacterium]NIN85257.1 molybdopterin-dependent oxidoreductase [Candidatus Aminicenantes bacterium]NIO81486.1 molybdopterin-dependent oxidoreductase [Candidatus Aminicenantes bacterium]NIQ67346.1 molybdopterin-dependent oxidoreductase [Candidatus Aminicenantes bacterium]NIT23372.1 molybdopterin-dependent oxidoreductase [Candidatus Aminicenantes bacterium]